MRKVKNYKNISFKRKEILEMGNKAKIIFKIVNVVIVTTYNLWMMLRPDEE